jgi:hypothetical protein
MSEYQYYEFQSIDRPLAESEIHTLRSISTRAEITSTSFRNDYQWGDLKADPLKLLEKYFDAFLYVADWGTRRFCLRLPKQWIDYEKIEQMLPGETAWVHRTGEYVTVGFEVNELDLDDVDDGTGWMRLLMPLRSDLLRGDFRGLYLGWLLCAQLGELDENQPEPPIPPGLRELTTPLRALVDFLCLDEDLVEAAASNSAVLSSTPANRELEVWVRKLPENEKTDLLVLAAMEPGERFKNELLHRFHRENRSPDSVPSTTQPRTVRDLLAAAETIANERAQELAAKTATEQARQKAEEEAARGRYLDRLANEEEAIWAKVSDLIEKKQPKAYDQAIRFLVDLRDLAVRQQLEAGFRTKFEKLRETHRAKTSFLNRLNNAGLSTKPA